MFNLLDWKTYLAAGAAILAVYGVQEIRVVKLQNDVVVLQSKELKTQILGTEQTLTVQNQWGFKSEAINQLAATRRNDTAVASTAADAIRVRYVTRIRTTQAACPTPGGAPVDGSDPIGVLAKLSDVSDSMAGVYAKIADSRRDRGLQCEQLSDALK